jgi:hypothetical protein
MSTKIRISVTIMGIMLPLVLVSVVAASSAKAVIAERDATLAAETAGIIALKKFFINISILPEFWHLK